MSAGPATRGIDRTQADVALQIAADLIEKLRASLGVARRTEGARAGANSRVPRTVDQAVDLARGELGEPGLLAHLRLARRRSGSSLQPWIRIAGSTASATST